MSERIDVLFIDRERRVVRIVAGLKPWRFAACAAAAEVWEMQAGSAAVLGLGVGEILPW